MLGSTFGGLFALTSYGLGIASLEFWQIIEGSRQKLVMASNAAINKNRVYTLTTYHSNSTGRNYGALYAVDCRRSSNLRLSIVDYQYLNPFLGRSP